MDTLYFFYKLFQLLEGGFYHQQAFFVPFNVSLPPVDGIYLRHHIDAGTQLIFHYVVCKF
jgi:hypothetical protein